MQFQGYPKCDVTQSTIDGATTVRVDAILPKPGGLSERWEALRREVAEWFEGNPGNVMLKLCDPTSDELSLSEERRSVLATLHTRPRFPKETDLQS